MSTITRAPVQSSNLRSAGYDPNSGILAVEFSSGAVYHYAGVPPEVYAGLIAAESKGRYFAAFIKPRYTGVRQPPETKSGMPEPAHEHQ